MRDPSKLIVPVSVAVVGGGVDQELAGEAQLVKKHPEHELGFYLSAYSGRLGGNCYAFTDSWLVPNGVELDGFFSTTDQNYRMSDFTKGEVLVIAGKSFVLSDGMVAYFPMSEYFKSRACASLARRHDEDAWPPDHFGWIDATFTHSPLGESLAEYLPDSLLGTGPRRESCLIHSTGTLVVIDDGTHSHVCMIPSRWMRPRRKICMKKSAR